VPEVGGRKRSRSRMLYREPVRSWCSERNRDGNRNALCRLRAVLLLTRSRDGGAVRGRRLGLWR
jgi:hypothetical protein